ncbi:PREDICTED: probable protein phosphatase 2C 22 [Tarenaya hassleriana]|uniref:probable protein phosphatase 2C 22 n=1 Tax=Tarenaya hassleriana TaxID=28532 RepID=UPI00053C48A2|nr:PREDICTED: probable protein phosphatase 2C 22 [Tarenaya hassleriana]
MEGGKGVSGAENGGSSYGGKPPNPLPSSVGGAAATACKQCLDGERVVAPCNKKSLVRHPSLVKTKVSDISVEDELIIEKDRSEFVPSVRSGAWSDIGSRPNMEDVYLCVDNFMGDYGLKNSEPSSFYGVFDGHGGKHAADFASYHLPRFIVEDEEFPKEIKKVLSSAFLRTDTAFAEACALDAGLASGTTALATLIFGRLLVVANAGDCRAVLCRRGKAIEMSRDHKPGCNKERERIEESGGYVYDGYLNGQLSVARAIGDFHMEGMKNKKKKDGPNCGGGPLIAEPEVMKTKLTEEDEFLIIGCDGIWDVFTSQNAVDFARRRLQEHNDPGICSKEVIEEALKRKSRDNMTVVVVCLKAEPPLSLVAPRSADTRVHRSFSAEGLKELQSFLDSLKC